VGELLALVDRLRVHGGTAKDALQEALDALQSAELAWNNQQGSKRKRIQGQGKASCVRDSAPWEYATSGSRSSISHFDSPCDPSPGS